MASPAGTENCGQICPPAARIRQPLLVLALLFDIDSQYRTRTHEHEIAVPDRVNLERARPRTPVPPAMKILIAFPPPRGSEELLPWALDLRRVHEDDLFGPAIYLYSGQHLRVIAVSLKKKFTPADFPVLTN